MSKKQYEHNILILLHRCLDFYRRIYIEACKSSHKYRAKVWKGCPVQRYRKQL